MPLVRMRESWPYLNRVFGSGFVYNVRDQKIMQKMIDAGVADRVSSDVLPPIPVETQPAQIYDDKIAEAVADQVEAQTSKRKPRGKK